jgi:hypothetical protein
MDDFEGRIAELRDRWVRLRDDERDQRKYNPNEPRIPKGQHGGGKWFTVEALKGVIGWVHPPKDDKAGEGERIPGLNLPGKVGHLAKEITALEARGNSRPVQPDEFQKIAGRGKEMLDAMHANRDGTHGLDKRWPSLKEQTYAEVRKSWGGATINAATGIPLVSTADKYALSVKPDGMHSVSVPETASQAEFEDAMERAKKAFNSVLQNQHSHLGIFHDDDNHRIDIDPVVVVDNLDQVEAIGAYTHAIGGAYHFASGDGFWPPHVVEQGQEMPFNAFTQTPDLGELVASGRSADVKLGDHVHWKGPGQWRSYADKVQRGKS